MPCSPGSGHRTSARTTCVPDGNGPTGGTSVQGGGGWPSYVQSFDLANHDADGDVLYLARGDSDEAADAALTPEGHGCDTPTAKASA